MNNSVLVLLTIPIFIFSVGQQTAFAFQATSQDNGALVSREVYTFPSYEQAAEKTDAEKYASKEDGGSDSGVTPIHALTLAQKLQSLEKTYQLIIYAGDNHRLTKNQTDRDRQTIPWFKSYLKK